MTDSNTQERTESLVRLLVDIDEAITKSPRSHIESQLGNKYGGKKISDLDIDDIFEHISTSQYYLSDGGYSRIGVKIDFNNKCCYLFLDSVSTKHAKEKWNHPIVKAIKKEIEYILDTSIEVSSLKN